MEQILLKPRNKTELTFLKNLIKHMDIQSRVIKDTREHESLKKIMLTQSKAFFSKHINS